MGFSQWEQEHKIALILDYKSAKDRLSLEKSKENYKKMLAACEWIVWDWNLMKDAKEIPDFVSIFEETVLNFWNQFKTAETLSYVVFFYHDSRIIQWIAETDQQIVHLKKGLLYAKLYHKMENKDYSAGLVIRISRQLCEIGRISEDSEDIAYAEQTCRLAKEYAKKYQTPYLLDEYQKTVEEVAHLYESYDLKETVDDIKRECKQTVSSIKETIKIKQNCVLSIDEKFLLKMDQMRYRVLSNSEEVVKKHRKEIFLCTKECLKLQKIAHYQGLDPLCRAGKKFEGSSSLHEQMLAYGINFVYDGSFDKIKLAEKMIKNFHVVENSYTEFILYYTICFFYMIQEGLAAHVIKQFLLSMLPVGERTALEIYLQYQSL